jgi:hypothetical protein
MVTVWVNIEDGKGWKKIPGMEFPKDYAHKVADYRNRKYWKRHYWVSESQPGDQELEQLKAKKRRSATEFVDRHS